ncbi:LysE family transporter [Chloroflexota bacterium]
MLPLISSIVVISFSGVMMPGLMFAATVAKSLKSPWAGAQIALGHAVIEIPIILLIYFGFIRFSLSDVAQLILNMLGGSMIIALGVFMYRARIEVVEKGKDIPHNAFITGIITTGINPYFLLWWTSLGSMLVLRFLDFGITGLIVLIIVHWSCDVAWLSFISNLVYRTHSLWSKKFQERIFSASSLVLVGFGVWYMVSGVQAAVS